MFHLSLQTWLFLGSLVVCYGVGFVTSLAFEAPLMGLEKIFFKRRWTTPSKTLCHLLEKMSWGCVRLKVLLEELIGLVLWDFRYPLLRGHHVRVFCIFYEIFALSVDICAVLLQSARLVCVCVCVCVCVLFFVCQDQPIRNPLMHRWVGLVLFSEVDPRKHWADNFLSSRRRKSSQLRVQVGRVDVAKKCQTRVYTDKRSSCWSILNRV